MKSRLLSSGRCYAIEDSQLSGEARVLVMVAILARLLVHTAVGQPSLWELKTDLFSFYTHILEASNRDFDLPFPWHLGIATGSYLRTGRTHARQTNVVDDFVKGKFYDESERMVFIIFVAHYLAQQKDPQSVLRAVAGSPSMLKFFAEADDALAQRRLSFLTEAFK